MYIFTPDRYAGYDKIFLYTTDTKINAGDLIRIEDQYAICLGADCSFSENYQHTYPSFATPQVIYEKFFSSNTISMIHWMVHTYYSSYKSVMKLFLPSEIQLMLRHEIKSRSKSVFFPMVGERKKF